MLTKKVMKAKLDDYRKEVEDKLDFALAAHDIRALEEARTMIDALWERYWLESETRIRDTVLELQWHLEDTEDMISLRMDFP